MLCHSILYKSVAAVLTNKRTNTHKHTAAARPAEKSASELLRDECSKTREGVTGTQSPVPPSSFQPRLGRGLVPGSVVDFASGGRVSGDQLRSQQRAASRKVCLLVLYCVV